jgi:hypothetical protein
MKNSLLLLPFFLISCSSYTPSAQSRTPASQSIKTIDDIIELDRQKNIQDVIYLESKASSYFGRIEIFKDKNDKPSFTLKCWHNQLGAMKPFSFKYIPIDEWHGRDILETPKITQDYAKAIKKKLNGAPRGFEYGGARELFMGPDSVRHADQVFKLAFSNGDKVGEIAKIKSVELSCFAFREALN